MDTNTLAGIERDFRGELIQPGDAGYDGARALYNAGIEKRPRLIARCTDAASLWTDAPC